MRRALYLFELVYNIYMLTKWENARKEMYKDNKNLAEIESKNLISEFFFDVVVSSFLLFLTVFGQGFLNLSVFTVLLQVLWVSGSWFEIMYPNLKVTDV